MADFWTTVLDFARSTTETVGEGLLAYFGNVQASQKADGSLVTQADKWADEEIRRAIAIKFPTHGILTEETEHIFNGAEWCWIVDPLDGTTNFTRGIPIWAISLGLLYRGTPVFGYVHLPPLKQSFHGFWEPSENTASREYPEFATGACLNNNSIHSSQELPSNNHFFSLCARSTDVLKKPFPCKIRMLGVATYNFLCVATGTSLGAVEATPKIWDIAAVWAIVQAAGAIWVPLNNESIFPLQSGQNYSQVSYPTLVASSPDLVSTFKPLVDFIKVKDK